MLTLVLWASNTVSVAIIVVLQINPLPAMPVFHMGNTWGIICSSISDSAPTNLLGKAVKDASTWDPALYLEDLDVVPGSWFYPIIAI